MSTLAYAEFTTKREGAAPGTSTSQNPPGVSTYVDALAALVPAEVLTLHALVLSVTTTKADRADHLRPRDAPVGVRGTHHHERRAQRRAALPQVGEA